jgi:D-alanyl-D-alanine carboxypeptidase
VAQSSANTEPAFAATLRPKLLAKLWEQGTPGAIIYVDAPGQGTWTAALGVAEIQTGAPMDAANHVRIGSITKTLTATAVLQLVDEGKLGLDDPIARYMPEVPGGAKITIRQLLNMTSGLFNTTEDAKLNQRIDANPGLVWQPRDLLAVAFAHPPYFAPGAGFHYSNTNTEILGLLVEKLTGLPLAKALQQRIFAPLGMNASSLPSVDDASIPEPHAHGYLYGTNTDANNALLAAFAGDAAGARVTVPVGTLPVDATNWNPSYSWASGSVISNLNDLKLWAKALATGSLLKPSTQRERLAGTPHNPSYGLGIDKFESIGGFIGHNGAVPGFTSFMGYLPERDATIIVVATSMVAPNVILNEAIPADALAEIVQQALFAK